MHIGEKSPSHFPLTGCVAGANLVSFCGFSLLMLFAPLFILCRFVAAGSDAAALPVCKPIDSHGGENGKKSKKGA